MYDGDEHMFVPTVKDGEKVLDKDTDYTVSYSTENFTDVNGTITVTITGKGNYEGTVERTYQITPRPVTLTSATDSKIYDGEPLINKTVTVSGDGFVKDEGATYDVTGSQTDAGSSANTFTYTLNEGTKAGNYTITQIEGKLTVNKKTIGPDPENPNGITVDTPQNSVYDGDEHMFVPTVKDGEKVLDKDTDYTVSYSTENFTDVNGTITVTITGKGNYQGEVTRTYKILPREVNLTSESAIKVYDGTPLTRPEVTGGDSFVAGEVSDLTATGSITEVGSVTNTMQKKTP